MLPQDVCVLRALEYAELANQAQDFQTRDHYRRLAAGWLRLFEHARQQTP
jgi:hypothetical protein